MFKRLGFISRLFYIIGNLYYRGWTRMPYSSLKEMMIDADMILIGIGEEFDDIRSLKAISGYSELRATVMASNEPWILPKFDAVNRKKTDSKVKEVLDKFVRLIEDKNYFVVSTSMNPDVLKADWKDKRFVAPCGSCLMKQCVNGCNLVLSEVSVADDKILDEFVGNINDRSRSVNIGICPECGGEMILNNVYSSRYNENGYLDQWNVYTRWLQGSLNKKLMILELGVGVDYPSIIRFPFEKIAFYNNKASFYRVNEKLYHLPSELGKKGKSIAENSIDWLAAMC